MYGKFFASTFTGSMLGAGADVFAVWGYVIAHAIDSTVELNPHLLAAVLGMKPEEVEKAIAVLCEPDAKSRNPEHQGRRLVPEGAFLYHVVSHDIYRAIRDEDDRRRQNREAQQRHRAKKAGVIPDNADSHQGQPRKPKSAHTEAEAEAYKEQILLSEPTVTDGNGNGSKHLSEIIERDVWPYYIQKIGKHPKLYTLTNERKQKGISRLRECIKKTDTEENAVGLMRDAIDAVSRSDYHMANKYNDWTNNLFKSFEKMEWWWGRL